MLAPALGDASSELFAEFERHGDRRPRSTCWSPTRATARRSACAGFLRFPGETAAALIPPVVARAAARQGRGRRAAARALDARPSALDVKLASAAIGSRNRAGYALLTAYGFRPVRQHFLMRCDDAARAAGHAAGRGSRSSAARPDDAGAILELYREAGFPRAHARGDAPRPRRRPPRPRRRAPRRRGRGLRRARHPLARAAVWVAFVGVDAVAARPRRRLRAGALGAGARSSTRGARSALLLLSPGNRSALRAYEKVGFRRHRLVDVLEKGL